MLEPVVHRVALDPIPAQPSVKASLSIQYGEIKILNCNLVVVSSGDLRLNFPDSPAVTRCAACQWSVPILHAYCGHCGAKQGYREAKKKPNGHPVHFHPAVHPIDTPARLMFEAVAFEAHAEALRNTRGSDRPRLYEPNAPRIGA